jgi:NADH-quinone oxidoreductase subunit N
MMQDVSMPFVSRDAIMPVVIVLLTGILALIVELLRPKQNNNVVVGVSLAGLAGAFAYICATPVEGVTRSFAGMVLHDSLGNMLQLILIAVCFICFLFSEPYLRQKRIAFAEFYPLALWSTAGGMIMATTDNLLMIFLGLEVLSISLYCMAGISRGESKSEESALKYFLLGAFASAFLLLGIAYLYGASGSLTIADINAQISIGENGAKPLVIFGGALVLIGLAFKMALVPFHNWTPDVYQGAPTNVSAFMAAASKTAAVGALIRLVQGLPVLNEFWLPVLFWIAILSMVVGNVVALLQNDIKRVMGYSSIANAGYILVGIISHIANPTKVGLEGALFYLAAYAATTLGTFAVISLTAKTGTDGSRFEDLNGLWRRAPFAVGMLILFVASLVGIPPLGGFMGKFMLFQQALDANQIQLAIVLAVGSVISVAYYLRIVQAAFVDDHGVVKREFGPESPGFKLTAWICAAGVIGMGVFAGGFIDQFKGATGQLDANKTIALDEDSKTLKATDPNAIIVAPNGVVQE